MKNLATILKAALAVATLAMSSCVVNDNEPFNNEPQAIGFNAVVGPISDSRAVITDLNYPNTLPFAAFASQLGDGKTWDTNKAEAVQLIGGDAVAYNTRLHFFDSPWYCTPSPHYLPLKTFSGKKLCCGGKELFYTRGAKNQGLSKLNLVVFLLSAWCTFG